MKALSAMFLLVALSIPAAGRAQDRQQPPRAQGFEDLKSVVKPGDTVTITNTAGEDVKGRIRTLLPSALALEVRGNEIQLEARDVATIRQRRGDSLLNGSLMGAAIGAGVGTVLGLGLALFCDDASGCAGEVGSTIAGTTLYGAGAGLLIDALREREYVIYEKASRSSPKVALALMTGKRRGMQVWLWW